MRITKLHIARVMDNGSVLSSIIHENHQFIDQISVVASHNATRLIDLGDLSYLSLNISSCSTKNKSAIQYDSKKTWIKTIPVNKKWKGEIGMIHENGEWKIVVCGITTPVNENKRDAHR